MAVQEQHRRNFCTSNRESHGRLDLSIAQGELKANKEWLFGYELRGSAQPDSASADRHYQHAAQLARQYSGYISTNGQLLWHSSTCIQRIRRIVVVGYWGTTEKKTRLRIQATSTIESGVRLSALLICQGTDGLLPPRDCLLKIN
jgi:hypothetical protein